MRFVGVATISVPVSDQEQALAFYLGTLGFEKRRDVPLGSSGRWLEVGPPGVATTVALVPVRDERPAGGETGIRFLAADADADHAELFDSGVNVDAAVIRLNGGVPPMFRFRDHDGNIFVVVEQR